MIFGMAIVTERCEVDNAVAAIFGIGDEVMPSGFFLFGTPTNNADTVLQFFNSALLFRMRVRACVTHRLDFQLAL